MSRAHSRMAEALKPADAALDVWGRWSRGDVGSVGWPARTVLGRVMEEGANGAAQTGKTFVGIAMPESVAFVEGVVSSMEPEEQTVLRVHYVDTCHLIDDIGAANAERGRRCKKAMRRDRFSIDRYKQVLESGRKIVAHKLKEKIACN